MSSESPDLGKVRRRLEASPELLCLELVTANADNSVIEDLDI